MSINFVRRITSVGKKTPGLLRAALHPRSYNLNGYDRVYLVHIRKTGGTSLNHMFLSLSGMKSDALYQKLSEEPSHFLSLGGLGFVGWNRLIINSGNYFYGFSHIPLHKLKLPEKTYRITVLRDPMQRVISHFKMLKEMEVNNIGHPCMRVEGQWLGSGFGDFIKNIPTEHLLNQIFMFSDSLSTDEALEKIVNLEKFFFQDQFSGAVREINSDLHLSLVPAHLRKTGLKEKINRSDLNDLREMLCPEYELFERIRVSNKSFHNLV